MSAAYKLKVGLVGLGNMGKGIGKNLAKGNQIGTLYFSELSVENTNTFLAECDRHGLLEKVVRCRSLSEMTDNCNYVGLSLPSEESTIQVLFGKDGLVPAFQKRSSNTLSSLTIFDHGTFSREFIMDNHKRAKEANVYYLDAPVSGGPMGADLGTLTIMAGGDISSCKPIWNAYSKNIFQFGDVGSGMAAKLINQALVGVHAQAACEVLYLAEKLQVQNIATLKEMLQTAWGQSKILDLTMADYLKAQEEGWETLNNSPAPLRNLQKDFKCILASVGVDKSDNLTKKYPLIQDTSEFIADACDPNTRALQDSAFVGLIHRLR